MRQPVDDRHISKMVGRKEALEVQCNGISNHVQTRFACTKGDRENLGGIFLDERLTTAQLRKRRSISVSCKDLLEIAPGSERTHYLRSGRPARSELSQLSPALSDNSHPLLNSNSQQPLLSPTLSERGHHLRTRSQLWSNLIDDESLLVTANNHSERTKADKAIDKVEKCDKGEKSEKLDEVEKSSQEGTNHIDMETEKDKEVQESKEIDLKPPRNHSRNRSIRRKRLSAEEKLIEDNRGYYKVEVLNSKLRSTGYYVNHQSHQGDETVNGIGPANGPGRSGSQGEKEPVVVRFKKVRRSELSVLSDEAENFMFGEQTKSETNSDDSSESDDDDDDEEDEEEDEDDIDEDNEDGDGGTDGTGNEENGTDSRGSRSSQRNGRRGSSSNCRSRDRPHRLKINVGNDSSYSRCAGGDRGGSGCLGSAETNGYRKCRKRRTQAEAFINDNMDYYKFEIAGSRLRVHGSPTSTSEVDEVSNQEKSKLPSIEEVTGIEEIDGTPCPIDELHFSFESVPSSEVWFQTFQRQDRGEELYFPSVGEPSSIVLPYQVPRRDFSNGQRSLGRRRTKNSVRLPRKSPRCHASTLAILSSVVKRRSSKEPEKVNPTEEVVPDPGSVVEPKNVIAKQVQPSTSKLDLQALPTVPEDCAGAEDEIQEMARSIDSLLGLGPGSTCDFEKDQDKGQSKSSGKGRGRKKQSGKQVSSNVESVSDSAVVDSDRDKDPSLNYLVDPAILEELACTCDVVSDPRGGPTMDILSLLDSYSDCCCLLEEVTSADHGVDASCNSSECGASSTCETDRRMRKKRKRRNMTGWDKPKRKCILRRDVAGVPEDIDSVKDSASKDGVEGTELLPNSTDSESSLQKVPNSISSPPSFKRKGGNKRKLRSSLSLSESSRRGNVPGQPRLHVMKIEKDGETAVPAKKGKCKKMRRLGWSKAR